MAGGADSGGGAGTGTGSFSTAGLVAAEAGGVVTAGPADGGGTTWVVVVATGFVSGFVSDCASQALTPSAAVMVPKPTSSVATPASRSKTARPLIR